MQGLPARHLVLVLLVCVAWGGNFLMSALALRELPAFLFTAARLALVGVILIPWLRVPASGQWWRLFAICLCNGSLHFGLSFWALRMAGDLSSPAIVMQSYVPMTTLLAIVLLGERIGWRTAAGVTVSFVGVLVLGFDPEVLDAPQSVVLMLISAFFLALGTVLMRGMRDLHPLSLQAWSAALGIPLLLIASALFEGDPSRLLQGLAPATWAGVAYSALIASVLGHSLFFWLVQRHPVSQLTPYLLLAPLIAIVLGVVFWGDRPGPRLLVGGAMVLGGVLAIALRSRRKHRDVQPASD